MELKKNLQQKMRTLLIAAVMLLVTQMSWSQIVAYDLKTSNEATAGIAANYPGQGRVMNISGIQQNGGYSGTNGQTCYGWNSVGNDSWVTSAFSTAGYINLTGSFQMKANTNVGPRDFKVQYSLNGSTWNDAATGSTITLTNGLLTYDFSLPSACDNKSTVYVRWVQNSTYQLNGTTPIGTGSTNNASLVGVSIAGNAFAAPSTQASNISIISVTPTTIKIGATNGNGNNRIVVINTANSFTNPVSDYYPTANTTYSGSGEQVIYNGTSSSVTVTVPSSTNVYWFRVYDFNKMDNLTRYNTSTASSNPKQCKLEAIHSPTSTNIGLINSTLGATITTPTTGTITERGIFWSTTSPVDENSNLVSESTNQGGTYTITDIAVDRGQTIYYKGYVTNESGTNMSDEASFSNVPIFTGTGTWETAARWNVQEVPGANGDATYGSVDDSPIINGTCTLGSSNNVTNLTINSSKSLTISPQVLMKVSGTLTNSAGTSGIVIQANTSSYNGSLVFASGTPQATVEMYSPAKYNLSLPTGSKYTWQYFGIPVTSLAYSPTFNSAYVRKWDESVTSYYDVWVRDNNGTSLMLAAGSTLEPSKGYELVQSANKKYSFTGTLVHSDFNQSLPYTPTAYFKGQTILSNPYTAAMDVKNITFGANTVAAVYLYNTGTFNDWSSADGQHTPGSGPGTYTVSTPGSAGLDGVPAQIPSMQGFLVYSNAVGGGSISYSYSSLVNSTERQRAKQSAGTTSTKIGTMIDVIGTNYSDRMWLLDNAACTRNFDNGYDGPKMLGFAEVSQLYGMEEDGIYQIDAVNDLNNTYLGFQPGTETSFKLVFKHQNTDLKYSQLYLVDLVANTTTDITQSGTEYQFTSTANDATKRFKIVTPTTALNQTIGSTGLNIFSSDKTIVVNNTSASAGKLSIFDTTGRIIQVSDFGRNCLTNIQTTLSKGTYIIKAVTSTEKTSKCIILN
jgi:hypothetical protein